MIVNNKKLLRDVLELIDDIRDIQMFREGTPHYNRATNGIDRFIREWASDIKDCLEERVND